MQALQHIDQTRPCLLNDRIKHDDDKLTGLQLTRGRITTFHSHACKGSEVYLDGAADTSAVSTTVIIRITRIASAVGQTR